MRLKVTRSGPIFCGITFFNVFVFGIIELSFLIGEDRNMNTAELKNEAKSLLTGNYRAAIRLNIFLILGNIMQVLAGCSVLVSLRYAKPSVTINTSMSPNLNGWYSSIVLSFIIMLFVISVDYGFLNWIRAGKCDFNPAEASIQAFSRKYFIPAVVIFIIQWVFLFFWKMLFYIPGLIKQYSYSQTYFIFKDIKQIGQENSFKYVDYVTLSRELMMGHKIELFMLQLSFIGWDILAFFTGGLLYIWLSPYKQMTYMLFYQKISANRFLDKSQVQRFAQALAQ